MLRLASLLLVSSMVFACSDDSSTPRPPPPPPSTYSVGGSVSGLLGTGLVLQNNGGDDLTVTADGSFTFATELLSGASYEVTVSAEPTVPAQDCVVTGGSGTIASADVTSVTVECTTRMFTVGGTVTGLVGSGLVLQNNGGDDLAISADGSFAFASALDDLSAYAVTVLTQPLTPSQTCTVTAGTGDLAGANVTDVAVACVTDTFSVGGTVSGLAGTGLVLQNNGGDDLTVDANGSFAFVTELQEGAAYEVTIATNPTNELCFVSNGAGTVAVEAVTDVLVECGPDLGAVNPLYSNGAGWAYYVENDGPSRNEALNNACTGTNDGYFSCIHGGEKLVVAAPSFSDCTNLTPTDTLMAFDWSCLDAGGSVRFVSEGLRGDRGLTDLIDFDAVAWRSMALRVWNDSGSIVAATQPAVWWSNPVVAADDSDADDAETLDTAGTVYIVTQDPTAAYLIAADHVALVVRPTVTAATGVAPNVRASTQSYLWIEGELDPTGGGSAVILEQTTFSVLRHVTAAGSSSSIITLDNSDHNYLWSITANGSTGQVGLSIWQSDFNNVDGLHAVGNLQGGLRMDQSNDNFVNDVYVSGTPDHGVLVSGGTANRLRRVVSVDNDTMGIEIRWPAQLIVDDALVARNGWTGIRSAGDGVVLHGVRSSNNGWDGIIITGGRDHSLVKVLAVSNERAGILLDTTSNSVISNVTVANNLGAGIQVDDASAGNVLRAVLAINNGGPGIDAADGSGLGLHDVVAAHGDYGVRIDTVTDYRFVGLLGADGASFDCWVAADSGTDGLDDDADPAEDGVHEGLCLEDGSSVFGTAITTIDATATIVGKATADEDNPDDSDGTRSGSEITDWTTFERAYRAWGVEGTAALFAADQRGLCGSELCRIWDYSLTSGDGVARALFATPTGTDLVGHTWYDGSFTYALQHATEVFDGQGNENGLCEQDEVCFVAPNIGAYQGHGPGVQIPGVTTGLVSGVSLYERASNGY